jgi:lipopolysaccharide transport system permease protein
MIELNNQLIIRPSKGIPKFNPKLLWKHRNIISAFALRDIKAQYAQTKLGILWSFIQAATAAFIINLFFSRLMHMEVENTQYILYAFPGMIGWYFFSYIVNSAGTSLVNAQHIIKKVYFPKIVLPIYKSLVGLVEFTIWFIMYIGMLLYFSAPISVNILLLPIVLLANIITGLSVAIWLSALTVRYRDVFHIIPYIIGFGVFVTPVFYETAMIPEQYHFLIYFNPMAGVIALYRWCFLDFSISYMYVLGAIPMIVLLITGLFYFKKVESIMADLI